MTAQESVVLDADESAEPTSTWGRVAAWFDARRTVLPTWAALIIFIAMIIYGELAYGQIIKISTLSNLLINNPHMMILALGLTFVIITGGIDLSVGAVVAFSSVAGAMLAEAGSDPFLVMVIMVAIGSTIGLMSGVLVQYFNVQPFIATLAMMFLARGLASILSTQPVYLPDDSAIGKLGDRITLVDGPKVNDLDITGGVIVTVVVVLVAWFILARTRLGRTIYAIGGKENSAVLMGLPVHRTKLWVYVISGTLSGIAAVVNLGVENKAQNITGIGWELSAIAAAVIGGTLLTGGAGHVLGSIVGALVLGLMNVLIPRAGNIPPAWTTIIIGAILLVFVLLQRTVIRDRR